MKFNDAPPLLRRETSQSRVAARLWAPVLNTNAPVTGTAPPFCRLFLGRDVTSPRIQDIGYPIDTKHCGIRGPSIWMQRAGTVASATAGIRPEAPPTTAARVPRF